MLAFYARGDAKLAVPGQNPFRFKRNPGDPPEAYDHTINLGPVKRIGRDFVPAVVRMLGEGKFEVVEKAREPASREPWKFDEESDPLYANKLARRVQEKALWPANEHTAAFCGVPFVKLEFLPEGEWVEAKAKAAPPAPEKSTSKPDAKNVAAGS